MPSETESDLFVLVMIASFLPCLCIFVMAAPRRSDFGCFGFCIVDVAGDDCLPVRWLMIVGV